MGTYSFVGLASSLSTITSCLHKIYLHTNSLTYNIWFLKAGQNLKMFAPKKLQDKGQVTFVSCTNPEEGGGGAGALPPPPSPLKNQQNIGFQSNTSPDPLKIHKATKPAFNVGPSSARQQNANNGVTLACR